jgi:hypothetical protein
MRVVGAQHPLPVGQGLLVQRDGLGRVPRRPVGAGEVIAGGQGLRVVLAQDPLSVGEGLLEQGNGPVSVSEVVCTDVL